MRDANAILEILEREGRYKWVGNGKEGEEEHEFSTDDIIAQMDSKPRNRGKGVDMRATISERDMRATISERDMRSTISEKNIASIDIEAHKNKINKYEGGKNEGESINGNGDSSKDVRDEQITTVSDVNNKNSKEIKNTTNSVKNNDQLGNALVSRRSIRGNSEIKGLDFVPVKQDNEAPPKINSETNLVTPNQTVPTAPSQTAPRIDEIFDRE